MHPSHVELLLQCPDSAGRYDELSLTVVLPPDPVLRRLSELHILELTNGYDMDDQPALAWSLTARGREVLAG